MSDVDVIQRLDQLENRCDEQDFEIERLQKELAYQTDAMNTMFKACVSDIQYLERNKKDDIRL